MKRFVPITRKINLIIVSSLVAGVGIVTVYFAFTQNLSLRETSRANLRQQSDILFQSVKNAMLPGEAPIAVQLFRESAGSKTCFTLYKPLLNLPKCTRCHGSSHTVRGVIDITSDITSVVNQQRNNLMIASGFFFAVVLALTLMLSLFLHGTLVRPVKHIGSVCATVANAAGNSRFSESWTIPSPDTRITAGESSSIPGAPEDPHSRGGWLWVAKAVGSGEETIIDWEFCFDCHANANEPHPYDDGNPGKEFRDHVFFPYCKP
jgi:hypothetical protein